MSYLLELVRTKPRGVWNLDTATLTDYSGYGNTATTTGTRDTRLPVVNGADVSAKLATNYYATFNKSGVYQKGAEKTPFTLVASIKVGSSNLTYGQMQVLSNPGVYDGLWVDGTIIGFNVNFTTVPSCGVTYDTQILKTRNIVATYDNNKISLWVDGVLVAENQLTQEQKADVFANTDSTFNSGPTSNNNQYFQANGFAIYSRVLNGSEIVALNKSADNFENTDNVSNMYDGTVIDISQRDNMVSLKQVLDTEEEWRLGQLSSVSVKDNKIVPTYENNISLPGYWLGSVSLDNALGTIFGVNINYDAIGALVEVSLDNTTWETCYRGKNISLITPGMSSANVDLFIRVTFLGGSALDTSYLNNLTVVAFNTNVSSELNGRTITFAPNVDLNAEKSINEFDNDWGVRFKGGYMAAGPYPTPTDPGLQARTIELWVKYDENAASSILFDGDYVADSTKALVGSDGQYVVFLGCMMYVNGVSFATGTLSIPAILGNWVVFHIVSDTAVDKFWLNAFYNAGSVSLSHSNVTVGKVITYPTALTASEISNIVKNYKGQNVITAGDNSVIAITESPTATEIYAHDWTIVGSG